MQLQQSHADGDDGLVARDGGEAAACDGLEAEEEGDGDAAESGGDEDGAAHPETPVRSESHREHRARIDRELARCRARRDALPGRAS